MLLVLTCLSLDKPVLPAPVPIGVLDARVAPIGRRLDSLPLDSDLPSRVRCSCWDMIDIELWRGGDETYGEESPERLVRAIGRALGLAPG